MFDFLKMFDGQVDHNDNLDAEASSIGAYLKIIDKQRGGAAGHPWQRGS
jgi:hypothetical protein